ncbi:MAG: LON peptidase substrate-binding domain-containing protein [Candidatus Dormibacteria bacterium]
MAVPVPLFLLRTVLFPHMPLSLHVFEERYRCMLEDCLQEGKTFGVVSIREGSEVDAAAEPRGVGTLAKIVHVQKLPDGRMNLLITGATRFRLLGPVPGRVYARANVEYLSEDADGVSNRLRTGLVEAFGRYVRGLQKVSGNSAMVPALPEDPEVLSYLVAATIEGSVETRQQLLEAGSARERMRMELAILRREADLLRRHVVPIQNAPGSFSAN